MHTKTKIKPGTSARRLFSTMVARSDEDMHLSLAESLHLSVARRRDGRDPRAAEEIAELIEQAWIEPHQDGGWVLL